MIIKLGGSVITYKREGIVRIRKRHLKRLMSVLPRNVVLVHGAGSYALPAVLLRNDPRKFYSTLKRMQMKMAAELLDTLSRFPVFYVDAGSMDPLEPGLFNSLRITGFIPLTGAAVTTKPSILSGDDVALMLGKSLGEKVIFLTDVPGVMDENGTILDKIRNPSEVSDLGKRTFDPSGGMKKKVEKIFSYEVDAVILSGFDLVNLRRFFDGGSFVGTVVKGSISSP